MSRHLLGREACLPALSKKSKVLKAQGEGDPPYKLSDLK